MSARILAISLAAFSLLLGGCARTIVMLDKPAYHYQTGMKFLNQGNLPGARTEFEYAVFLDDSYAQALLGLALVQTAEGELEKASRTMQRFLDIKNTMLPPPTGGAGGAP